MRFLFMTICLITALLTAPLMAQEGTGDAPAVSGDQDPVNPTTRDFDICAEPESWGTSTEYLRYTARCAYGNAPETSNEALRVALIEDIYIKSWAYALMNKLFFWASIVFAVIVLIWPSLVAFLRTDPAQEAASDALQIAKGDAVTMLETVQKKRGILTRMVGVASMQTTVTALAALSFAFYAHYKDKQTTAEGLMRTVLYAEVLHDGLIDQVITQMTTMDRGFGFSKALPSIANANEIKPNP